MRIAVVLVLVAGCGADPSVEIFFPNVEALDATHRLRLEIHDPGSTGAANCADFAATVAKGDDPVGSASRDLDVAFPFERIDLEGVPRGRHLIYTWAYSSEALDMPPFLAGCTDRFDSTGAEGDAEDVAILLEHIPYATMAIRVASGDRQVARPGVALPRPLEVAISAVSEGRTFGIPGADVVFTTNAPFSLEGGTIERRTRTDGDGIARTTVQLSAEPNLGSVRATAPLIENAEASFTVSALDGLEPSTRSINVGFTAPSIALTAAVVDGNGVDLIGVGEAFGVTRLMVASEPMSGGTLLAVPDELGVAPVGVAVIDGRIAIANAHLAARENAEVRLLRFDRGAMVLDQTEVLTASNAIALASFVRIGGERGLAVATTGRTSAGASCPQDGCGACPPDELCQGGSCVPHDGLVVVLGPDPLRGGKLREEGGCSRPSLDCEALDCCPGASITCEINDCGCRVPRQVRLGSPSSPLDPRAIASGRLQASPSSDLVVPTLAGLSRLEQSSSSFDDAGTFVLTPNAIAVVSDDFDLSLDGQADIVWIENAACERGASTDSLCPITAESAGARGCLGLWLTEQGGPAAQLKPPENGACRRVPLAFTPGAICLAELDGDGLPDLVVSSPEERRIYAFAGDGNGGVLEPPQPFDAAGGAMTCADFDGDERAEVVVADEGQLGRFHFLSF